MGGKQTVESPTREASSDDADLGVCEHPHAGAVPNPEGLAPPPLFIFFGGPSAKQEKESSRVEHEPCFMLLSSER
jgi:hypothetical protein